MVAVATASVAVAVAASAEPLGLVDPSGGRPAVAAGELLTVQSPSAAHASTERSAPATDQATAVPRDRIVSRGQVRATSTKTRASRRPTAGSHGTPTPALTTRSSPPASDWVCGIADCGRTFTSGYGARVSPGGIGSTYHRGDDFAAAIGTPVRAMNDGVVSAAGWNGGEGLRVALDFGQGTSAVYAHLSRHVVAAGGRVSAGQVIAYSGNTGHSTGPHLHLEIHRGGLAIDPTPWLRARGIF